MRKKWERSIETSNLEITLIVLVNLFFLFLRRAWDGAAPCRTMRNVNEVFSEVNCCERNHQAVQMLEWPLMGLSVLVTRSRQDENHVKCVKPEVGRIWRVLVTRSSVTQVCIFPWDCVQTLNDVNAIFNENWSVLVAKSMEVSKHF